MLDTFQPDDCCGHDLAEALLSGTLETAVSWTHDLCGCEWRPRVIDGLRYWEPYEYIEVFQG